jgi:hypothetical protein
VTTTQEHYEHYRDSVRASGGTPPPPWHSLDDQVKVDLRSELRRIGMELEDDEGEGDDVRDQEL